MNLLLLGIACVSRHSAPPAEAPAMPVEGTWDLRLDGAPDWQHHALALEGLVDGRLRGRVWFDRSLGPEGRPPTPDEVLHEVAFEAEPSPPLALRLRVGTFEPLTLALSLTPDGDGWVGTAALDADPPQPARATPAGVRHLRPWEELPRADTP